MHSGNVWNVVSNDDVRLCLLVPQDFIYHGIAAFFYLSASVALAKVTFDLKDGSNFQNYQLDISAVVSSQRQQQQQ